MALSIAELLDKVVGREDVQTSINTMMTRQSAVGRVLDAVGNPMRTSLSSPTLAYSSLTDPVFSTWDNSAAKTSQSLVGDVGEVSASTAYAIVAYPLNYEDDLAQFTQQFSLAMANGFAKYVDDRVINTASIGIIPLASGVSNVYNSVTVSPTSYQLRTDLVNTMGLVLDDGYRVNGIVGELGEEANVLNSVGENGLPVFITDEVGAITRLVGKPYASTDINLTNTARFVVGDWTKVTVGTYKKIEFRRFESGSVNIGGTEYNLIERNMVAVVAEARMLFKVTVPAAFAYLRA